MDESPFKRASEMKQMQKLTRIGRLELIFVSKLKEILVRFIPFIGDIHPDYLIPLSIVISIAMGVIFVSIFITGYSASVDKQFLAPVSGTNPSKYCQTISAANTGEYLATESGLWEGNIAFQYAESAYTASITSWESSYEEYAALMNDIYLSLVTIGDIATNQDLAQNLVYWMSLVFVVPYSNAQRFYFNGTPLTVLNRQNTGGTISNVFGDCNATSSATFDQSTGLLILNYDYEEFIHNPVCNNTAEPLQMGHTPGINSKYFTLKFDVRTLITSLAININVTYLSDMVEIPGFSTTYVYDEVTYNTSQYYDPKYPGMAPLTCISYPIQQCILTMGETYAIPIFNHAGANTTLPQRCDCSVLTADYLDYKYSQCNLFSFLSGFIFWRNTGDGSPNAIFELSQKYNYNYKQINADAFNASFLGSYWGVQSPYRDMLNAPEYRQSAYAFCDVLGYGPCSLGMFSSFDTVANSWPISSYYYQLQNGACRNTFTTTPENWQKLITTPFAPLTQQYQQCVSSPNVLFFNQAGITMGNMYLLLPFCALFFVGLFHMYKACRSGFNEKLYSEYEVKEALKALSVSLLLARDNKIASLVGDKNDSNISVTGADTSNAMNSTVSATHCSGGKSAHIDSLVVRLAQELTEYTEIIVDRERHRNASTVIRDKSDVSVTISPLNHESSTQNKEGATETVDDSVVDSIEDGTSSGRFSISSQNNEVSN